MTREDKIQAIIEYFEENSYEFEECIEDLDNCNGTLGDDRYYPMDEIDDYFSCWKPSDIVQRIFYGSDEYGDEFCPNREYFKFDGYGNLVSADSKDYSSYLDEYTIEEMHEWDLSSIEDNEELSALFSALDEDEDEESEDEADEE